MTGALIDRVCVACKTSTTCKAQYCVCDRHNYYYTVSSNKLLVNVIKTKIYDGSHSSILTGVAHQ